jgi:hypothetical protein
VQAAAPDHLRAFRGEPQQADGDEEGWKEAGRALGPLRNGGRVGQREGGGEAHGGGRGDDDLAGARQATPFAAKIERQRRRREMLAPFAAADLADERAEQDERQRCGGDQAGS